ncbi:hypothetical protein PILCRDRAFT_2906 [Piloderma croceum F 1598]|uniref:Uncharacterized protein n=1 Tax=Piloderma croceum (strain F 1598) TaxID=765440 RepID=A0A0C3GDJ1_PILCF|nr:hypothetical protein PILCRDRAFT_2906 [Piloderma croceum F 1598]
MRTIRRIVKHRKGLSFELNSGFYKGTMLTLLSRGAARLFDVQLETPEGLSPSEEDEEALSIDINALTALLPSPDVPWRRITDVYGQTISPIYKSIRDMLMEDAEHVARLLSELEPLEELEVDSQNKASEAAPAVPSLQDPPSSLKARHSRGYPSPEVATSHPHSHRKRRRSSDSPDHPVLIPSTHPSTPSIIITPCATLQCPSSSWVPLQDASYGNKLAVPGYAHFNSCFAPLILKPGHIPLVECWKWKEGHWWAIIPDLEEQGRKGWFSRPLSGRRRAARLFRTETMPADFRSHDLANV